MKLPLSWLKEYVSLSCSPEELAQTLTLAGIEVEGIEKISPPFSGVVIATVVETTQHPHADRLQVAQVFDGKQQWQVVCGASNCRPGITVAFATIGALLPGEEGKPWKIKKGKIRDIESYGMLCARSELGKGSEEEGIWEISTDKPLGTDIASLETDYILDLSLTPNLGHCLSLYGIAREVAAFLQIPLRPLPAALTPTCKESSYMQVTIEDPSLCSRYRCALIENVQVGASPLWLQQRLEQAQMQSVNIVVDISNYVLLLTGQPLHCFDYHTLASHTLHVRSSREGEIVQTLDKISRTLPADTIVIQAKKEIAAIAGVMGSYSSQITTETKTVLLEAACFSATKIRKTSKQLGLKTEASYRFERGTDPQGPVIAIQIALNLLQEYAGGTIHPDIIDIASTPPPLSIPCREEKARSLLGIPLSLREMKTLLERLEIVCQEQDNILYATPPSYRNDLKQEVDLIEEIGRVYGINNIPRKQATYSTSSLAHDPLYIAEIKARTLLLEQGLQEFLTCDLLSPEQVALTEEKSDTHTHILSVLEAKSQDYSVLRPSLLPGLLAVLQHNAQHGTKDLQGFEVGKVHFSQKGTIQEHSSIGILLAGQISPYHHDPKTRESDFFDLKGIVENFLERWHLAPLSFIPSHLHTFQPGRQARIECQGMFIGALGEIHPAILDQIGVRNRAFFATIDLNSIRLKEQKRIAIEELATQPSSERDWTVTVPRSMPAQQIETWIQESASKLLERFFLLNLFEHEKLGNDKKNLTYRFLYRDKDKTVEYATVEKEHTKITQKVAEKLDNSIL